MGKKGGNQKKGSRSFSKKTHFEPEDMDDEIDTFHKQRDIVPLDVNDDTDETDEDEEHPVFDIEDNDEDEDDEEEDEDAQDDNLTTKIIRQKKYLRAKFGNVEDEMADDDKDKDGEDRKITWGGQKGQYHGGDNADFEIQSSDDEALAEEEAEVLRLQREAAASLTAADVGLEDEDSEEESDRELTLGEIPLKHNKHAKQPVKFKEAKDGMHTTVEEVKKDINSLSKEEQMDVVYSSAPELVGLLSELNDAVEQLENKINPVMSKIKEREIALVGGTRYLEVKQLLLLAYCQAITFYLLLKSEGQPVRDHPVVARLVEIKGLLDKIKELDGNLPPEFEETLKTTVAAGSVRKTKENSPTTLDSLAIGDVPSALPAVAIRDTEDAAKQVKVGALNEDKKEKGEKHKRKNAHADLESKEMLRLRAALEEKLKNNGIFSSTTLKPDKTQKRLKSVNGKLETFDDYVDDADNTKAGVFGLTSNMLSQLASAKQKRKIVSGDDDLPKRDDIGERRRKFELRVLAGAGVKSEDDGGVELRALTHDDGDGNDDDHIMGDDGESETSEDDFYEQVKRQREAKLAAKAEMYSRPTATTIPSLPETVDGKRQISYQMEKNRGLTRKRNKDLKNPRKKYRKKHEEKVKRRKGQVKEVRKPSGPYGGETTGINASISRSVRFKN